MSSICKLFGHIRFIGIWFVCVVRYTHTNLCTNDKDDLNYTYSLWEKKKIQNKHVYYMYQIKLVLSFQFSYTVSISLSRSTMHVYQHFFVENVNILNKVTPGWVNQWMYMAMENCVHIRAHYCLRVYERYDIIHSSFHFFFSRSILFILQLSFNTVFLFVLPGQMCTYDQMAQCTTVSL